MIDEILDQLTLEEQVSLLAGADVWTTAAIERLNVPKIKVTDGPNGARGGGSLVGGVKAACYPAAIALGASWSPALLARMGVSLAGQVKSKGASVLLAPTVNIHRSGLNGRNFECYSEDPHLTAELAVAYIQGVQGLGVAATIKHFVGNESEVERQTISSDIDERSLREIYLYPFEQAVKKAGVMAVMSSYNRLNGTYTSEHKWLLDEVLRRQWGFDGIVMSDWFGSHSTVETMLAGLDLEMPGPTRDRGEKLVEAVKRGDLPASVVKQSARRILQLVQRVGAFENPPDLTEHALDLPEDRALIREMAIEGSVLLKNDGILPLALPEKPKIALIGPNAATARIMGGGSAQINAHYRISPLEGLSEALGGKAELQYALGCRNSRLVDVFNAPLTLEYFNDTHLKGECVLQENGSSGEYFWFDLPNSALDLRRFSVRFKGQITVEDSGTYVFGMTNAGLAKLYLNDQLVINGADGWVRGENYFGTANSEIQTELTLDAGKIYDLRVEYLSPAPEEEGISITAIRFGFEKKLDEQEMDEAVQLAAKADIAILVLGREAQWDTEGQDLPDMHLPGAQVELIERVHAVNPNVVIVLQTGGPVEMPWLNKARAVLQIWYPGQELGHALADMLLGHAEPAGRLPQTFPQHLQHQSSITGDPRVYPGQDGHVVYEEGVFVGYRHYDRADIAPLFPFGFGLGYTSFIWEKAALSAPDMSENGVDVTLNVKNTGAREGSDVVQVYVRPLNPACERPEKELRAFAKIRLKPGEMTPVSLHISPRDLSYFDVETQGFVADAGAYEVLIGANAADIRDRLSLNNPQRWFEPA